MIELRHGVNEELAQMVFHRFVAHRAYSGMAEKLGIKGVAEKLAKFDWVVGFYMGDKCVAALWGSQEINLATRVGYENRWLNLSVFRKFWNWFFSRYTVAVATPDNGLVIPFLLRMGFHWENAKMVCRARDLKLAA